MKENKLKTGFWNEQNKKRYLTYLRNLIIQDSDKEVKIIYSHFKHISQYIFRQNYKQSDLDKAYDYHSDKLIKYKNIEQIVENESNKYFQSQQQIKKYLQELKQWEYQKEFARINWDQYQKDEKKNLNQMKQIQGWYIANRVSQGHYELNNLSENQQLDQKQQLDKYIRAHTINPMISLVDEQQTSSVLNQQINSQSNKNHSGQQQIFSDSKVLEKPNPLKKIQTTKIAYQYETIVELDLPQILIANTQQTLFRYHKSEQYQKTKENSVQFQNQYESNTGNSQNRLYYLSSQINCLKRNGEVQQNSASESNTMQHQTIKQEVKQILLEIKIPYTLYFQYQIYEEDQKIDMTGIRNSFINCPDKIIDQQEINQKEAEQKQIKLQQQSNSNQQFSKRDRMDQEQSQSKKPQKQKNKLLLAKSIKKKSKPIKYTQVFWTQKEKLKLLAFIQYHSDQKHLDYMKMATYIPNKQQKNFKSMIDSLRQNKSLKQGLNAKKKKLNQKQLKILKEQMKFLRQLDKEWSNQRFLLLKNKVNKNEIPVQRIKENDFETSLIFVKNNKRSIKVKYCYKEKEVTSSIQKMQQQRSNQKKEDYLSEQEQSTSKNIVIQHKKRIRATQRWNQLEHIGYLIFIIKNKQILQESNQWIKKGLYTVMSKFIKSRNSEQCYDKHKNMISNHGSIQKIIYYLKQTIQNKDLYDNQLRQYENYFQNTNQQKVSFVDYKITRFEQLKKDFNFNCKNNQKDSKNISDEIHNNNVLKLKQLKKNIVIQIPKRLQKIKQKGIEQSLKLVFIHYFPIIQIK